MKFFISLLCFLFVQGEEWTSRSLFLPEKEYFYRFDGMISTGIASSGSEKAVTRIRSDVIFQFINAETVFMKLKNVEFANENLIPGTSEMIAFDRVQQHELTNEYRVPLEEVLRFDWQNGLATNIRFSAKDPAWSNNIKRSIISMIQLNWKKLPAYGFIKYESMEKLIEGECQTHYYGIPYSGYSIVSKVIDFNNCTESRMDMTYNMRFTSDCPGCLPQEIVPQTIYDMYIEKNLLKKTILKSDYSMGTDKRIMLKMLIQSRLILKDVSNVTKHFEILEEKVEEDLVHNWSYDKITQAWYKTGDEVDPTELITGMKKLKNAKKIVKKMAEAEIGSLKSTEIFFELSQYLRVLSRDELKEVYKEVVEENDPNFASIIESAIVAAGTKNSIEQILSIAEDLPIHRIVQYLKFIQEAFYPSEKIAQLLIEFSKTEKCRNSPIIYQSTWLTYGSIVRGAIGPHKDRQSMPSSESFKGEVLETLTEFWQNSNSIYEKVLVLKTMANAGLEGFINLFEKVIMDKKQHTVVRMEAIDALRLLSERMPHKIQKVLLPVFSSHLEKNEIRMAALRMILQAKPALPELSQIVSRMEREPNQHVAAFTYKILSSLAESKIPCHHNVSLLTNSLLRASQYRPESRLLSQFQHVSAFDWNTLTGLGISLESIIGNDAFFPADLRASLSTIFAGHLNMNLLQVGFSQQNLEDLYNKVLAVLSPKKVKTDFPALQSLAKKLNLKTREKSSDEAFTLLYIRYKNMDYFALPIDKKIIVDLFSLTSRMTNLNLSKFLPLNTIFDYPNAAQFTDSQSRIYTSLGVPLYSYKRLPMVGRMSGKLGIESKSDELKANLQLQTRVSSFHVFTLRTWIPIFANGVKVIRSSEINLPIDLEIGHNSAKGLFLNTRLPKTETQLFSMKSDPLCFVRYFRDNTTKVFNTIDRIISVPEFGNNEETRIVKELAGHHLMITHFNMNRKDAIIYGQSCLNISFVPNKESTEIPSASLMIKATTNSIRSSGNHKPNENYSGLKIDMTIDGHICKKELTTTEISYSYMRNARDYNSIAIFGISSQGLFDISMKLLLPKSIVSLNELQQDEYLNATLNLKAKWITEKEEQIDAIIIFQQSLAQKEWIQEIDRVKAQELLSRLARLNQLKANINYELSPKTEKVIQEYFGIVKAYTFWSNEMKFEKNEPRRIVLQLTSEPMATGFYNLTVQTPESRLRIEEIQSFDIVPTIVRQPKNFLRHTSVEKAECKIEKSRIRTFEDAVIRAPLSSCYTVVAKDCSEEPRFAVLVKKVDSEKKMVKIMYENDEYELAFPEDELKITLNGLVLHPTSLPHSKIELIGEQCVIDFDDAIIRFNGYWLTVLISRSAMNKQCGLCGNPYEKKYSSFLTAQSLETTNFAEFHQSFIIEDESCSKTIDKCSEEMHFGSEESNDSDDDWKRKRSRTISYTMSYAQASDYQTAMKEKPHKVCFTIDPIPKCPIGSEVAEFIVSKVPFACYSRYKAHIRQMIAAARRGEALDSISYDKEYTGLVQIPTQCVLID